MSKFRDFLYKAGNVIIDVTAQAANEAVQNKVCEHNQKSAEKRAEKKQVKANTKTKNSGRKK